PGRNDQTTPCYGAAGRYGFSCWCRLGADRYRGTGVADSLAYALASTATHGDCDGASGTATDRPGGDYRARACRQSGLGAGQHLGHDTGGRVIGRSMGSTPYSDWSAAVGTFCVPAAYWHL